MPPLWSAGHGRNRQQHRPLRRDVVTRDPRLPQRHIFEQKTLHVTSIQTRATPKQAILSFQLDEEGPYIRGETEIDRAQLGRGDVEPG